MFKNESDVVDFYCFIDTQHPNIRFTFEKEIDKKLPFLDVLIDTSDTGNMKTTTYYKHTQVYSLIFSYKVGLAKTLIGRAYKINSSWTLFENNLRFIKHNLQRNSFSQKLLDRQVKEYLDNAIKGYVKTKESTVDTRFYKLPYIGEYSTIVKNKIRNIVKRCCEDGTSN